MVKQRNRPTGDDTWKWVLRFAGLAGIAWQTIVDHSDRPELLVVFAAMVGLDQVLKWDAQRRERNGGGNNGRK
jgi:hypothetical protein